MKLRFEMVVSNCYSKQIAPKWSLVPYINDNNCLSVQHTGVVGVLAVLRLCFKFRE